mgnify:FL=1
MYDLDYGYSGIDAVSKTSIGAIVWGILSVVIAIVGGLLVYFLFIKKDCKTNNKFVKWLKEVLQFKVMFVEIILKVVYLIATIYVILLSFSFIGTSFFVFLSMLLFGPIAIRLIFEQLLMFIMVWKNTSEIAKNTKK